MKRDLELIRTILFKLEDCASDECLGVGDFPSVNPYGLAQHLEIMEEADLIIGKVRPLMSEPPLVTFIRLTWSGYEFLDVARDDTIWHKAIDKFISSAGSWTWGILLDYLKYEAKTKLGLPTE